MRVYFIYLIEDEFAEYFYGREYKIVELFKAKRKMKGENLRITKKQIDHITRSLPYFDLHKHLAYSVDNKEIFIKGKVYCSNGNGINEGAELFIGERWLQLKAWGSFESETVFFEILRRFDGHFLAIDLEHNQYGWVKPMKERKYV